MHFLQQVAMLKTRAKTNQILSNSSPNQVIETNIGYPQKSNTTGQLRPWDKKKWDNIDKLTITCGKGSKLSFNLSNNPYDIGN